MPADQAQYVAQVVTIQRRQRTAFAVLEPIDQQGSIGRDRVALHQKQPATGIVAGGDYFVIVAKQGAAINSVGPHQVGRAHEGTSCDLLA
ncbi:hypothetical protein D3C86_1506060 [compost metagenome]